MKTAHFFSSRQEGVNESTVDRHWRFGRGNVFAPSQDHPDAEERRNANANQLALLNAKEWPVKNLVLLRSQYGKGVQEIDEEFLNRSNLPKNEAGLIVVAGDGLFTRLANQPLLNVSGDAHSIMLESQTAIAILVGSWHCIQKDIFSNVMDSFLSHNIQPDSITLRLGPGLGASSYSIGEKTYLDFKKMYGEGEHNKAFATAFIGKQDAEGNPKPSKKDGSKKYVVNFAKLMELIAAHFQIGEVIVNESKNTFDKAAWKEVKAAANNLAAQGKIDDAEDLLTEYYKKQNYFGARQFTRVERQIARVHGESDKKYERDYARTGRCLNGVMLQEDDDTASASMKGLSL